MLDLSGKRVTVMGLGRFGGGIGVSRWLAAQGCEVMVTDLAGPQELAESVGKIKDLIDSGVVTLRLGGHNVSDFTTCDAVVASPAVPKPWENRFLRAAEAAAIPITTEIRLLVERLPDRRRTIGVTGSAGKSTTCAMAAHILRERGAGVHFGGNIGGSLLGSLPRVEARDWVVLELSSFMLHWLGAGVGYRDAGGWSPGIAVLSNLSDNHADWHGSFSHYASSKANIAAFQDGTRGDIFLHHRAGFEIAAPFFSRPRATAPRILDLAPDEPWPRLIDPPRLTVPGLHNQLNARLAVHAASLALYRNRASGAAGPERGAGEFPPDFVALWRDCAESLASYRALPHRLQLVAEQTPRGGQRPIRFYNDSKSTTPESTLRAIEAVASDDGMSARQIHLIAGGYDKGSDLAPVATAATRLAGLYAIGATGPGLAAAATAGATPGALAFICECGTLERAVERAFGRLRPGDALLLSPACASWDQFVNFEQRGDAFTRLIRERLARQVVSAERPVAL